jgi:hypothetical protein
MTVHFCLNGFCANTTSRGEKYCLPCSRAMSEIPITERPIASAATTEPTDDGDMEIDSAAILLQRAPEGHFEAQALPDPRQVTFREGVGPETMLPRPREALTGASQLVLPEQNPTLRSSKGVTYGWDERSE